MSFSQAQIASALVEQIVTDTPDLILKEIEKRMNLIEVANDLIMRADERLKKNNELLQKGNNLLPEKLEKAIAEKREQLAILEKLDKTVNAGGKYEERLKKRVEEIEQKIEELEKSKAKAETIPKEDIVEIKEKINQIECVILEDQELIKFAQDAINTFEQRAKMLEEQRDSMLKIEQMNQKSSGSILSIEQQSNVQCRLM